MERYTIFDITEIVVMIKVGLELMKNNLNSI